MTIDPSYRPIGNLTDWLVRFSIVSIILSVVSHVVQFFRTISLEYISQTDIAISIVSGIISVLVTIILLIWFYRATKNIRSFGAKEVTSPGMAVVWWFIPILHLWKPYQVAQQIWKASYPNTKSIEGNEWKNVPNSNIVKAWWGLGLLFIFGAVVTGAIGGVIIAQLSNFDPEQTDDSILRSSSFLKLISIPFLVISIFSTFYFIWMVTQVSKWQYQKSRTDYSISP